MLKVSEIILISRLPLKSLGNIICLNNLSTNSQLNGVGIRPEACVLTICIFCLLDKQVPKQADFLSNSLPTCWVDPAWIPPSARRLPES